MPAAESVAISALLSTALSAGPGGTARLRVVLTPGAARPGLRGYDAWREAVAVAVDAPARDGRANRALCRLLEDALALPAGSVSLVGGAKARRKTLLLPLSPGEAATRLAQAIKDQKAGVEA